MFLLISWLNSIVCNFLIVAACMTGTVVLYAKHRRDNRSITKPIKTTIYKDYLQSLCQIPPGLWRYFCDQAFNSSFHDRLASVQYNACLAIPGAIRGTLKEKFYQELGLESLRLQRWYRKLCLFIKFLKTIILNTFSI